MSQAYIGIIPNNESHTELINRAVWAIHEIKGTRVSAVSRIYRTIPKTEPKQPFYTAAVRVETSLTAKELHDALGNLKMQIFDSSHGDREPLLDIISFENFEGELDSGVRLPRENLINRPDILAALLSIYNDSYYRKLFRKLDDGSVRVTGDGLYMPL